MTENDRVKALRKELGLTMEKFGDRIGVKKSAISDIENGRNRVSDQVFKSICREFNVSSDWLRDGTGDMFITLSRNESIAYFVEELMKEERASFKVRLIDVLSKLDEDEWQVLADLAKRLAEEDDE